MSAETDLMMDQMMDLAAMHSEELHPDLVPYLTVNGLGMKMIAHPLVHDLLPVSGLANQQYLRKKQALAEAIAAKDWHSVVFLHERPYRCEALIDYVLGRYENSDIVIPVTQHTSQEVRDLVVDVWTDSENIHQHVEEWMQITSGWFPGQPLLLASEEERAEFDALPDLLIVWRGDCDDGGWSWSLDNKVAEFFARRFSANHALLNGYVDKRNVFGFITRRSEAEVMVRREHVKGVSTITVSGNEEEDNG